MTAFRNLGIVLAVALSMSIHMAVSSQSGDRMELTTSEQRSRKVKLVNRSGKKLAVDWINPDTGESVSLSEEFNNGAKTTLDSFVNHTFAIHEPTNSPSCGVNEEDCGMQFLTIDENSDQVVVNEGMVVAYEDFVADHPMETIPVMQRCRETAQKYLLAGFDSPAVMDTLVDCLENAATDLIQDKNEEIAFESKLRLDISAKMENHTCADPTRETSTPKEVRSWTHEDTLGFNVTRQIGILHNRPDSQIHALDNFISKEECNAITKAAATKLHRGTVADGSGGSQLSDHRKAWQAGIKVPWEKEKDGDLIARVVRRVYDYLNHAVQYNLEVEGQEDLMSIQYFGNGNSTTETPDQYRPHCDGDCDGLPHKSGGRVATMVMYCDAPERGGGTNFQNANVFVKPKVGAAAFFSYLNVDTMKKESGFTSHSGCPVIEGTKRIAVHWMRYGVDAENPWNSFNTLTIKKGEGDC